MMEIICLEKKETAEQVHGFSELLLDCEASREIDLVFMDDVEYIFSRFVQPGFKHVYAIERQALGWICHDPSRRDLFSHILPASYNDEVMGVYKTNNASHIVMGLEVKPNVKTKYPALGFLSCVSVMQYMLGVWWPFVRTPYGLYSRLLKDNTPHIKLKD